MEQKPIVNATAALCVVIAGHFLVDLMIGFLSVYKTLAGLDLAVAGLIAGLCPFIGEGMQLLFGSLGDKGYRKELLIFGIAAVGFNLLLPFAQSYLLVFLLYLITCIGSGAFHPTAVAVTSNLTQNRKGLYITMFTAGGSLGLGLSHIIFTGFYTGTAQNILFISIPILLLIAYISMNHIAGAAHVPSPAGRKYGLSAMLQLSKCRPLRILYAAQLSNQSILWATIFMLPDVLVSKGYAPWISFGAGHLCFILGGALMMIPCGHLADKYSTKLVLLGATGSGFILFYTFLFAPMMPAGIILSLLLILGACMGITSPVTVAHGNRLVPSRPGLVSALLMGLVWCFAESLGPGSAGLLTKLFAVNAPTFALSCLGVFFITGIGATLLLPDSVEELELEA